MKLADFLGLWLLERDIQHGDGTRARFRGTAQWHRRSTGALYTERGTLEMLGMAGQPFQAERRYHWGEDLQVSFEDGRYFHTVPMAGGAASHWCDPDHYDVEYTFSDWPNWHCHWQVRGPRKSYEMTSRYRRAE